MDPIHLGGFTDWGRGNPPVGAPIVRLKIVRLKIVRLKREATGARPQRFTSSHALRGNSSPGAPAPFVCRSTLGSLAGSLSRDSTQSVGKTFPRRAWEQGTPTKPDKP